MPSTDLIRMRPQAPSEQAPMSEPGPISEQEWLAQIAQAQARMPQQPTLGSYIAGMKAQVDPSMPQMRAAPKQPAMGGFPNLSDLISMFQGKATPDPATDNRLGQQAGAMFQNNQRHAQALDDFDRERARNAMLLSQLQGVR